MPRLTAMLLGLLLVLFGLALLPARAPVASADGTRYDPEWVRREGEATRNVAAATPNVATPGDAVKVAATPAEDLRTQAGQLLLAAADVLTVDQGLRADARYLDLGNLPAADREWFARVTFGLGNGVSRGPTVLVPAVVEGSGGTLLRLNLRDWRLGRDVYDRLERADARYHEPYEFPGPGAADAHYGQGRKTYKAADGRYYDVGTYAKAAFWVTPTDRHREALRLLERETHSRVPLLQAEQFADEASHQAGTVVGYYGFLGLKDQRDFERLVGFDRQLGVTAVRGSVRVSGVSPQPRALAREQAGGWLWQSSDFVRAVRGQNPLAVFGADIVRQADAHETLGPLPNGLQASSISNRDGALQDSAPDTIAVDRRSPTHNDTRVHVGWGCALCHLPAGGYIGFRDHLRPLLAAGGPYDRKGDLLLRAVGDEYTPDLEAAMARDRLTHEAAVRQATGWTAAEYAERLRKVWRDGKQIDLAQAARETGVPAETLGKAIRWAVRRGERETVLTVLTEPGGALPVRQFDEAYPRLWKFLEKYDDEVGD